MSATNFIPTVGSARRSQGIFTYGVGSIVDFTTGSFMPLGLQHMEWQWSGLPADAHDSMVFHEPRLQHLLGIREFRGYPIPGDGQISDYGDRIKRQWGVPCVRFPKWLECPKCHRLGRVDDPFEAQPDGRVRCTACDTDTNPVRFITACRKGHISDFPWVEWAHENLPGICDKPVLFLRAEGRSAALSDLYVECAACKGKGRNRNGLGSIFRPWALKKWPCRGRRPWLLMDQGCGEEQLALQRGGSNVHFSVTASMLSIPPASESIAKVLERDWDLLSAIPESGLLNTLKGFLEKKGISISPQSAYNWVLRRREMDAADACEDEGTARHQEFESLSRDCPAPAETAHRPEFENHCFALPDEMLKWIDLIGAVSRLREVRAYCGFTRVQPYPVRIEEIANAISERRICALSGGPMDWRPAVEVRGEGIFFRLNEETVAGWAAEPGPEARAAQINEVFRQQCARNGYSPPYRITPRTLLVHSLAHILIRRLSLDCGYSSASLRERLYISEGDEGVPEMAGILVYTASPDSDGSLGGLVNLATVTRIGDLVRRAIRDALWCGNDPVCSETDPMMSGERLSGAACHNCLLVPETACERFNRELDRIALIGFEDHEGGKTPGFFDDFPLDEQTGAR